MWTISIQAGGGSRRMGADKALRPFLGRPLIARLAERLAGLADELLVTANRPQEYAFVGLPVHPDLRPGRGALGGLHTALTVAAHPLVAAVACDLPFLSPDLLRRQRDLLESEQADVVVPAGPDGLEPLHALYRRATCLPLVESALDADQWKMTAWFERARVRVLAPDEWQAFDPRGVLFFNCNTPDEFARAEALAREYQI